MLEEREHEHNGILDSVSNSVAIVVAVVSLLYETAYGQATVKHINFSTDLEGTTLNFWPSRPFVANAVVLNLVQELRRKLKEECEILNRLKLILLFLRLLHRNKAVVSAKLRIAQLPSAKLLPLRENGS